MGRKPLAWRVCVWETKCAEVLSDGGEGQLHWLPHWFWRNFSVVPCTTGEADSFGSSKGDGFSNFKPCCVSKEIVLTWFRKLLWFFFLFRVRRFSIWSVQLLLTWHCLSAGAPLPIRTSSSLGTKWTCATSAHSSKETHCLFQPV